jgi:transcription initiation factor TFIIH subunit 2
VQLIEVHRLTTRLALQTWEAITEDRDGLMDSAIQDLILKARRERLAKRGAAGRCRLGMMRHLYLILDMSANMATQDLRPTRLRCALKIVELFIEEFFYLNPISQLGLIVTRDKRAEVVTELAGNPKKHLENVRRMMTEGISNCRGEPSLQNSLETAMQTLRHKPGHASREVRKGIYDNNYVIHSNVQTTLSFKYVWYSFRRN